MTWIISVICTISMTMHVVLFRTQVTGPQLMASRSLCFAEPMVNAGTWRDHLWPDGWTDVTQDGSRSAQFEHQIVITKDGADILTARLPTSPPLWWEAEAHGAAS